MDEKIWRLENKRKATETSIMISLLILITMLILVLAIGQTKSLILLSVLALFLLSLLWCFSKIKYCMLEYSGEVFTIKYHHPFIKRANPVFEMPVSKINRCEVKKGIFSNFLRIKVTKNENKDLLFYYHLQGFSATQIQHLKVRLYSLT